MKGIKKLIMAVMVLSVSFLVIVVTGNKVNAAVGGQCSNCHTMHYSQGGAVLPEWGVGGPFEVLLTDDCIGCHTTTGDDPLDDTDHTPYVFGSANFDNDKCLAGGFFTNGGGSHNDKSHTLGSTALPAGYVTGGFYQGTTSGGLSCAGVTGCHGDEVSTTDMEAIKGGHHNTAKTYRMLYVGNPAVPVAGTGSADYEESLIRDADPNTTTSGLGHNIYSAGDGDVTVSELCGKCHGVFHSGTGGPSPFTRHPTDVDVPDGWEIIAEFGTKYTDADRKYNPLGFAGGTSESGAGRATCLSCHRAHGSAVDDILRFAYSTQLAGSGYGAGCLGCHSNQR